MNAFEAVLALVALRVFIPFGCVLLIGEWMNRHERARLYRL